MLIALTACVLVLPACGDDEETGSATTPTTPAEQETAAATTLQNNPDNAKVSLTIGSKNFTEQKELGEIYAQAFEAAGFTVKTDLNLGDEKTALKAVESGQISAYP